MRLRGDGKHLQRAAQLKPVPAARAARFGTGPGKPQLGGILLTNSCCWAGRDAEWVRAHGRAVTQLDAAECTSGRQAPGWRLTRSTVRCCRRSGRLWTAA